MKNNFNSMREGKVNKILDKQIRYDEYGVLTRREWLRLQMIKGAFVEEGTKNRIRFDRIKYNRMKGGIWSNEQEEYEKKCNERVVCYNLKLPGESAYWEITKTEYDHFKAMQLEQDIMTERMELTHKIEAGTATDEEMEQDEQKDMEFFTKYAK